MRALTTKFESGSHVLGHALMSPVQFLLRLAFPSLKYPHRTEGLNNTAEHSFIEDKQLVDYIDAV